MDFNLSWNVVIFRWKTERFWCKFETNWKCIHQTWMIFAYESAPSVALSQEGCCFTAGGNSSSGGFFCIFRDYRAKSKAFHVFRYRFSPVPKWLKINVNKLIFFHSTHLLYFSIRREKHTPAMVFWCCVFVRTNLGNITIAASWTTWCWFIHMSSAKLGGNLWSIVTPIGCQM